jgi:hypothetical protein
LPGSPIVSNSDWRFFAETFRWIGNAGCGAKNGLKEFQANWQRPFQAAFSDKVCTDEAPRKRALFDKLRQQFDPSGKAASPKG